MGKPTGFLEFERELLTDRARTVGRLAVRSLLLAGLYACKSPHLKSDTFYYETLSTTINPQGVKLASTRIKAWFKGPARRIEVTTLNSSGNTTNALYVAQGGRFYFINIAQKVAVTLPPDITPLIEAPAGALAMALPPDIRLFAEYQKQGAILSGEDQIDGVEADRYELTKTMPTYVDKRMVWIAKKTGQLLRVTIGNTSSNLTTVTDVKNAVAGESYTDDLFQIPPDVVFS